MGNKTDNHLYSFTNVFIYYFNGKRIYYWVLQQYRISEMFDESSARKQAQALPSSQFANPLPVNANWSALSDVDNEALQGQKQVHGWEIACTRTLQQQTKLHQFGLLLTSFCMKQQQELIVSFPLPQQFTDPSISSIGALRQRWWRFSCNYEMNRITMIGEK